MYHVPHTFKFIIKSQNKKNPRLSGHTRNNHLTLFMIFSGGHLTEKSFTDVTKYEDLLHATTRSM